ncbi:MAG TPA: AI-2E family transporter [Flavisolibacter sp.]|nr:AI-2E family transporter [Flavisolibacter sp.]
MATTNGDPLYKSLIRAISYAVGAVILLWFLFKISGVVLLLLFALILAIVINMPVAALEERGMKRGWACLIVFGTIALVLALMGWLIIPKISDQVTTLINNLPGYANNLSANVSKWFKNYPEINKEIQEQGINLSTWLPSVPRTLMSIGNYTFSIVTMILIFILFISMVVYSVTRPRPLLELYFSFFAPEKHDRATEALRNTSIMLGGWIRANVIGGGIRGVCITIFLSIMGVPGAWVWGALAFFSELIPKLGFYIMAIPPILVALSVSPATALWVTVFMLALDEIMGDFILPKLRSNTMNIHPVSILFILMAMASAFGVMGALLATPLTAIIKAYYEAFFCDRFQADKKVNERIDRILYRKKGD